MSLEQAISDHAGALRELAAAIKLMNAGRAAALALPVEEGGMGATSALAKDETTNPAREAINAALAAARAGAAKTEVKPDAELDKAVSKVEEAAGAEQTTLTYTDDVLPVLMKLNKSKGKDVLKALLDHFDAAKGDKIKPEKFADVIAYANDKLAA